MWLLSKCRHWGEEQFKRGLGRRTPPIVSPGFTPELDGRRAIIIHIWIEWRDFKPVQTRADAKLRFPKDTNLMRKSKNMALDSFTVRSQTTWNDKRDTPLQLCTILERDHPRRAKPHHLCVPKKGTKRGLKASRSEARQDEKKTS